MAISKTEDLFKLIKSLTKSEKRAFRLYAERIQDSDTLLYMQLFDIMDKQKKLNEKTIKTKMGNVTASKYSNAKRHLYEQILVSLRLVNKSKKPNIRIREYLDFAYLLYGKGLYMQALKIIDKAKKVARQHQLDFTLLTIIEVEKMIQSRHITRSKSAPIETLMEESDAIIHALSTRIQFSNLRLALHNFYVRQGQVQNQKEEEAFLDIFEDQMPNIIHTRLGQMEKVYLYQSYVWYYYILNDFKKCYKYAEKWVELFKQEDNLITRDINLFFRGYHYLLLSLYNLNKREKHAEYQADLEKFRKGNYGKFNKNTQIISFLYVHLSRLNQYFLDGNFEEGVKRCKNTLKRLERYKGKIDKHKEMIFYYKIAWMHLGNKQAAQCIDYLQIIIDMTNDSLRNDIQVYTRLMFLMAHYELENFSFLNSAIKNYSRFFKKLEFDNQVTTQLLLFFKEAVKKPVNERKKVVKKYLEILKDLKKNKYEKRAFLYLDAITWLKSL